MVMSTKKGWKEGWDKEEKSGAGKRRLKIRKVLPGR